MFLEEFKGSIRSFEGTRVVAVDFVGFSSSVDEALQTLEEGLGSESYTSFKMDASGVQTDK